MSFYLAESTPRGRSLQRIDDDELQSMTYFQGIFGINILFFFKINS